MSCEEVPSSNEDPYVFTDSSPPTVTVFNSQSHKLTSIAPTSIATNDKQIIYVNQKSPVIAINGSGADEGYIYNVNGVQQRNSFLNIFQRVENTPPATVANTTISDSKDCLNSTFHLTGIKTEVEGLKIQNFQLNHGFDQSLEANLPTFKISKSSVKLMTGSKAIIKTETNKNTEKKCVKIENKLASSSNNKKLFPKPNKKDKKVLVSRKICKKVPSQNPRKKRSYSQTTHHEALQRISSHNSSTNKWHAPNSYIFDKFISFSQNIGGSWNCCDKSYETVSLVQKNWLDVTDIVESIPNCNLITREQKIQMHKAILRRQAMQHIMAQKFRKLHNARRRLTSVSKILQKLNNESKNALSENCCYPGCTNDVLALTAYCSQHITQNTDQFLFPPCTARFPDNSQCCAPVFDITHELPLCTEHAWKRNKYNHIIQENDQLKKMKKRQRSISKSQKRKQKKRKIKLTYDNNEINTTTATTTATVIQGSPLVYNQMDYQIKPTQICYTTSQNMPPFNQTCITQETLNQCENSSAYESSEDTGVGGLSESELIVGPHDIIEEIPLSDAKLLEEHDITNVLNQLPVDAFNELFTQVQSNGPMEPTQEEKDDLERALAAVDKQVLSLQQMTGGDSAFLGDLLDVDDKMLDDTDICTEVVLHSPDVVSGLQGHNIIVNDANNGSAGCNATSDIRELVQT